jgi:DtxR family Mn-dependent transcriptional regulator
LVNQNTITKESEEYLEVTYKLQEKKGIARTSDIAKELQVSLGSVTNTIESLEQKGLVKHYPYKGVKLTQKGRKYALDVIRKHRLAERLMTDFLNMKWSEVHESACQLEHALSKKMLRAIEKKLGYPKNCPHGNPIPSRTYRISNEKLITLTKLQPNKKAVIIQILEEKAETLRKLEKMKIFPGTIIKVEEKTGVNAPIKLKVQETSYLLDFQIASVILVKKNQFGRKQK